MKKFAEYIKNKGVALILITLALNLLLNAVYYKFNVQGLVVGVTNGLWLCSYILLTKYPMYALFSMTIAQIFSLIDQTVFEESSGDSELIIVLFLILATLIHLNIIENKNKQRNKEVKLLERLKNNINYTRIPYKNQLVVDIILLSLMIITINFGSYKLDDNLGISTFSRTYMVTALFIPTFEIISIALTGRFAYLVFLLKILLEIFTILSIGIGNVAITKDLYLILEIIIFIYCIITIKNNEWEIKNENSDSKKEQDTKN